MQNLSTASAKASKTCSKCNIEKPVTEFHRRGYTYQNICKTCRVEYSTLPHAPRAPRAIETQKDYTAIGERIQQLEARLRMIARQYSKDPHQTEDIFQYICEDLIRNQNPADSDSRILTTAKRRAGHFLHLEKTYSFTVGAESEIGTANDEEETDSFDYYTSDPRSAEDMIIEREQLQAINKAISLLADDNQKVIAMLNDGMTRAEIAEKLGVSRAAVTMRLDNVTEKIKRSLLNL